jgi:hypothetical protein
MSLAVRCTVWIAALLGSMGVAVASFVEAAGPHQIIIGILAFSAALYLLCINAGETIPEIFAD